MRPAHVLVISDDEQGLHTAAEFLRNQLFRVSFASGWQGYYDAQAWHPDLILIDGDMGQMNAFMMGRLLMQSPDTRGIPLMFLVNRGKKEMTTEAFALGAVDCVSKPPFPEELLARISVHLRHADTCIEAVPKIDNAASQHEDTLLRKALDAIQSDVGSIHTIRQLARQVGTHERKLSALFKTRTGKSAHKFIFEKKMATARRLLSQTGMPVRAVAQHVGFRSVCNFTVAFRRHEGITPTSFRGRNASATHDGMPAQ